MKYSWCFVCWMSFLLAIGGCKQATLADRREPVWASFRQIIITNPIVVGSNETDDSAFPGGTNARQVLPPNFVLPRYSTATNLAIQIIDTDHVVLSKFGSDQAHSPLLVSGKAAKQVVEIVSQARYYTGPVADPGWGFLLEDWGELQFFKGNKQLTSVTAIGDGFRFDNKVYQDVSGVLGKISDIARTSSVEIR